MISPKVTTVLGILNKFSYRESGRDGNRLQNQACIEARQTLKREHRAGGGLSLIIEFETHLPGRGRDRVRKRIYARHRHVLQRGALLCQIAAETLEGQPYIVRLKTKGQPSAGGKPPAGRPPRRPASSSAIAAVPADSGTAAVFHLPACANGRSPRIRQGYGVCARKVCTKFHRARGNWVIAILRTALMSCSELRKHVARRRHRARRRPLAPASASWPIDFRARGATSRTISSDVAACPEMNARPFGFCAFLDTEHDSSTTCAPLSGSPPTWITSERAGANGARDKTSLTMACTRVCRRFPATKARSFMMEPPRLWRLDAFRALRTCSGKQTLGGQRGDIEGQMAGAGCDGPGRPPPAGHGIDDILFPLLLFEPLLGGCARWQERVQREQSEEEQRRLSHRVSELIVPK